MHLYDFEALALRFRSHRLLVRLDDFLPRTLRPTARCQSRYDPMEGKDLLSETRCDVSSYHSAPWLQKRSMVVRAFRTQLEDLLRGKSLNVFDVKSLQPIPAIVAEYSNEICVLSPEQC